MDRAERTLTRHGFNVGALPRVGDGVVRQVNLLVAYSELIAISMARAEFLGALLAEQIAADGEGDTAAWDPDAEPRGPEVGAGLVGFTYAASVVGEGGRDGATHLERVATGEEIRALAKLESDERDRAARLIKDAMKIGVELHAAEAMRTYGASIAASLQAFTRELGIDEHAPEVERAAKRAVLTARRAVGQDEGDPDRIVGPALTEAERERVLRRTG